MGGPITSPLTPESRSLDDPPERFEKHEQAASLVGLARIEGGFDESSVSADDDFDGQPGAFDAGYNPGRQFKSSWI